MRSDNLLRHMLLHTGASLGASLIKVPVSDHPDIHVYAMNKYGAWAELIMIGEDLHTNPLPVDAYERLQHIIPTNDYQSFIYDQESDTLALYPPLTSNNTI